MDADRAADWLVRYAMNTPAQAAQRVKFFDPYRSYVINYNLGEDLVKAYVERARRRRRGSRAGRSSASCCRRRGCRRAGYDVVNGQLASVHDVYAASGNDTAAARR